MIVSVHKSKAGVFASCLNNHPMVDIISADVKKNSVEYEIDAPDFLELPDQAYNTPSFYLPSSYSFVCQLSAIQTTAFSDGNATAPPRSF